MAYGTQDATFDIDEVSEADLWAPEFQPSPLTPDHLDAILRRPDLLPPGFQIRPLDSTSYALTPPGTRHSARITARPSTFEEHFQSMQLFGPGGPLFERVRLMTPGAGQPYPCSGAMEDLINSIGARAGRGNPH